MTFDFAPNRLETSWQDSATAPTVVDSGIAIVAARPEPSLEKAPAHPSSGELALLVRELFAEGSLTWDQLQSLSRVAELRPMLEPAMAGIPSIRRVSGHRQ